VYAQDPSLYITVTPPPPPPLSSTINHIVHFLDAIIVLQVGGIIDMFGGETNTSSIMNHIKDAVILLRETVPAGHIILMNLPELSLAPGMKYAEEGALIKENFVTLISQVNNVSLTLLPIHFTPTSPLSFVRNNVKNLWRMRFTIKI
jgi:hypothetical protein